MKVNGLILAAGMSSRMGDFKPLMKINNKTTANKTSISTGTSAIYPVS